MTHRQRARSFGRDLVRVRSDPGRERDALLFVLPPAVALLVLSSLVGPVRGMAGMLGAMGAMAGRTAPPMTRLRILLAVGAAIMVSQTLGMAVAPFPLLLPVVLAVWGGLVVWAWHAVGIGPPGPLNLLFAGIFGSYMATHGYTYATLLPTTGLSFLIAATVSMLVIVARPNRPARRAVRDAEDAVTAYRQRTDVADAHTSARLRSKAHSAVHNAWWILHDGAGHTRGDRHGATRAALMDRLLQAHLSLADTLRRESFPSASVELPEHISRTPLGRPSTRYLLSTAAERGSRPLLVALRAATGIFFAASAMELLPFGHPYWAVLSVLILLHMDQSRTDMTIRAVLRVAGTAVGLGLYLLVMATGPNDWARVVIVIVSLWCVESLVTRHYGLAVIFITTFALVMTPRGPGVDVMTVARDRIEETVIGVLVGVAVIHVVGRRAPVLLVRSQYRRTLRSMMPVLRDLARGAATTEAGLVNRNHLIHELIRGSGVLSATRPDAPLALQRWSQVDRVVTETGYDLLACCWHATDSPAPWAAKALADIAVLITSLPPISSQNLDAAAIADEVATIRHHIVTSV